MPILNWIWVFLFYYIVELCSNGLRGEVRQSLLLFDCFITEFERNTYCGAYKLEIISLKFKIFSSERHIRQNLQKQWKGLTWNAVFSQLPTWACEFELESHPEHTTSTCYFQLTSPVHPPKRFAYSFKQNNLIEQAVQEVPIITNCHTTRLLAKSKVRFFSVLFPFSLFFPSSHPF